MFIILVNIMEEQEMICKVWVNKGNSQKLITIPKKSKIKKGDYVKIKLIKC